MALQLTGGFKEDSLANLQVRLPALVIGGGLTGIDTTTEAAAYYPVQVEKFLARWEALVADNGGDEAAAFKMYDAEEAAVAREFLEHGRAVRAERARAEAAGEAPDFADARRRLGRRLAGLPARLKDSPGLPPQPRGDQRSSTRRACASSRSCRRWPASPTSTARSQAVRVRERRRGRAGRRSVTLPARSLFVAAGTQPNITYEHERPGTFEVDASEGVQALRRRARRRRPPAAAPAARRRGRASSRRTTATARWSASTATTTPVYAGSVVRAMASAKDGTPHVAALFRDELRARSAPKDQPARDAAWPAFTREARRRAARRRSCASIA